MGVAVDQLRGSRTVGVIDLVERGEPVDWEKLKLLAVLDIVRAGELLVVEALEREDAANEQCAADAAAIAGAV